MLTHKKMISAMRAAGALGEAVFLEECASTNIIAREMISSGAGDMSCAAALSQTAGKGRSGRAWISPKGAGLYVTVILRHNIKAEKMPFIALLTASAVRAAIDFCGGGKPNLLIKWPNDIVIGGKKVCGILTEGGAGWAIAGIGVNVSQNEDDFPPDLREKATSLAICGCEVSSEELLRRLLENFRARYELLKNGHAGVILNEYRANCVNLGKDALICGKDGEYRAKAVDIAEDGALIVERGGILEKIYAGDVSVRGIMGYV